jgi:lysozyme
MKISESGLSFLIAQEGEVLTVYKDIAGKDTIGVGHLVLPGENFRGGITTGQSRQLLKKDVEKTESLINSRIKVPLSQNQYDALGSLVFNIPAAIVGGTVDDLINSRATEAQIRSKWLEYSYANGKYSQSLRNRRQRELNLYFSGKKKALIISGVTIVLIITLILGAIYYYKYIRK